MHIVDNAYSYNKEYAQCCTRVRLKYIMNSPDTELLPNVTWSESNHG